MQYLHSFQQLSQLLTRYKPWWQFQPFHFVHSRWQQLAPELHHFLTSLPQDGLEALEQDKLELHRQLQSHLPHLETLNNLCELPRQSADKTVTPAHWQTGIPGKKWQQITAFSQSVKDNTSILEWCAGKGHLGRYLALKGGSQVLSMEWQQELCESGQLLAQKAKAPQTFQQQDVFAADTSQHLHHQQTAVALHACGDLHKRVIQLAAEQGLQGLHISPCCYHLIQTEKYQPLSLLGQQQDLQLCKTDLSMCLRQTVTAGAREKRQRQQELLWRLSFDCLQRQLRRRDNYLPLATIPRTLLKHNFAEFIDWCCQQKHLPLPKSSLVQQALEQGQQRLRTNLEMELVQHCFQRPLEIWLALDKALYLQQQGYRVELMEFCSLELTPRNILLNAHKPE